MTRNTLDFILKYILFQFCRKIFSLNQRDKIFFFYIINLNLEFEGIERGEIKQSNEIVF